MTCNEIMNRIREKMKAEGVTYYTLATKSNLNPSTVRRWLRGEAIPNVLTLAIIADNLGMQLNLEEVDTGERTVQNLPGDNKC